MLEMKCPKCRSGRVSQERRIDGDAICMDCHHRGKPEEFRQKTNFDWITETRQRWQRSWYIPMTMNGMVGSGSALPQMVLGWRFGPKERLSTQPLNISSRRYEQGWLDWLNSKAKSEE